MSAKKQGPKMDLNWPIPMRSAIQGLALEIYNFSRELSDDERARLWPVQGYLVGIAFSLWRAVFLSLPERDPTDMYEHGDEILRIVLQT